MKQFMDNYTYVWGEEVVYAMILSCLQSMQPFRFGEQCFVQKGVHVL